MLRYRHWDIASLSRLHEATKSLTPIFHMKTKAWRGRQEGKAWALEAELPWCPIGTAISAYSHRKELLTSHSNKTHPSSTGNMVVLDIGYHLAARCGHIARRFG